MFLPQSPAVSEMVLPLGKNPIFLARIAARVRGCAPPPPPPPPPGGGGGGGGGGASPDPCCYPREKNGVFSQGEDHFGDRW